MTLAFVARGVQPEDDVERGGVLLDLAGHGNWP